MCTAVYFSFVPFTWDPGCQTKAVNAKHLCMACTPHCAWPAPLIVHGLHPSSCMACTPQSCMACTPHCAWPAPLIVHGLQSCTPHRAWPAPLNRAWPAPLIVHGLHPSSCMASANHRAWPAPLIVHGLYPLPCPPPPLACCPYPIWHGMPPFIPVGMILIPTVRPR